MTTQPIRDKRQIKSICQYFSSKGEIRNLTLFLCGIYTALRISDILALRWGDIFDFDTKRVRTEFNVTERKTGKRKTVAVNSKLRDALLKLQKRNRPSSDAFVFAHPHKNHAISRIQAYRIIRKASDIVGMSSPVSCHSLRKTFGYHLWKKGTSLVVIMDIYNHSSFDVTRRYLGLNQDDRNSAYYALDYGL
jgi:integrase